MLAKADQITVIGLAENDDEAVNRRAVEDVANFIRGHGASAVPLAVSSRRQSVASQLTAYAETNGVGLIVLGGYGHARVREWIFGGVTQSLLRTSRSAASSVTEAFEPQTARRRPGLPERHCHRSAPAFEPREVVTLQANAPIRAP